MRVVFSVILIVAAVPVAVARPAVTIPFESANTTIFVRTEVNSHAFWFALDTGAGHSVIDLAAARAAQVELGDSLAVTGAGQSAVMGRLVRRGSARLPGLDGVDQPLIVALPLDRIASISGHEFAGILGSDFIARFVVEIDYERHVLTLRDTGYDYHGHGDVLPITFNAAGHPQVTAQVIDGHRSRRAGTFVVDTGSGAALILDTPFVEREGLLATGRVAVPWIEGQGLGGDIAGVVGRVDALVIGRSRIRRPVTVFSRAANGPLASQDAQGNIGAAILEKFRVTLDYARMRIILEPNRRFSQPTEYNRSGLSLTASGPDFHDIWVAAVAEDSPAARADLRAGDRLVAIDGRPAESTSLSEIRLGFRDARRCALTIERGGERLTRALVLRRRV
ncbi:MAG TPA: aspartyl protease family protein [Gemmatimonadales bacterium]|nr:aspartyl protease family protein [Gemmatimonadales bacterium]